MGSSWVRLNIDKAFYTAGDKINGTVQAHSERAVKVRSLDVHLQGEEKVVIDPPVYAAGGYHKAHYSSTNEMLNTGLRLLENTILGPEDKTLPFQFQLPTGALPSYVGAYTRVVWKLQARTDIPWGTDLNDEGYLRVLAVHSERTGPVAVENREAKPRLRLELPTNIFEPGEVIEGKLTLLEPGSLRSVRLQIIQTEDANARGTFTTAHKDQSRNVSSTIFIGRGDLPLNSAVLFQVAMPELATSDYKGAYSSVSYYVETVMDIPHADDIRLYASILVGLKGRALPLSQAPASVAQAKEPATTLQPASPPPIVLGGNSSASSTSEIAMVASSPATLKDKDTEAQMAIILILGDGSSKELIEISTELQVKNQSFLDLNEVKKLCEGLVSQGKLRRTTEGEFFAKYALSTPAQQ